MLEVNGTEPKTKTKQKKKHPGVQHEYAHTPCSPLHDNTKLTHSTTRQFSTIYQCRRPHSAPVSPLTACKNGSLQDTREMRMWKLLKPGAEKYFVTTTHRMFVCFFLPECDFKAASTCDLCGLMVGTGCGGGGEWRAAPADITLEWLLHRKLQGSLRRFQLPVSHVVPCRRSGWESHDYRKPPPRAKRHQSSATCFNKSNATSQCSSDRVRMMANLDENMILFIFFRTPKWHFLFGQSQRYQIKTVFLTSCFS